MLVAVDSSAIVKLVLAEEGSQLALLAWSEADTVVATRLARIEAGAAVAAARRARRIGSRMEARAHDELDSVWREVVPIELDRVLETRAAALARVHVLSGADALHLAAAVDTGATLLTWDQRQAAAARAEGITVLPS